jgi:hypothetical protein
MTTIFMEMLLGDEEPTTSTVACHGDARLRGTPQSGSLPGTGVFPGGDECRLGAMLTLMTMYLPNHDVRPTGYEAGEFLESPTVPPVAEPNPSTPEGDDEDEETSTA